MNRKKRIGLLVAVEMDSVFARYGEAVKTERRGGFDVYRFENDSYTLHVIHSGIGEIAAAAAARFADSFSARALIPTSKSSLACSLSLSLRYCS